MGGASVPKTAACSIRSQLRSVSVVPGDLGRLGLS